MKPGGPPKPLGGGLDAPPEIGAPKAPPPDAGAPPEDQDSQPGGKPYPDPAAVGFRQLGEDCDACEYSQAGQCLMLNVPTGLTCSLFEAKAGDVDTGQPGGMPPGAMPGGMPPGMGV